MPAICPPFVVAWRQARRTLGVLVLRLASLQEPTAALPLISHLSRARAPAYAIRMCPHSAITALAASAACKSSVCLSRGEHFRAHWPKQRRVRALLTKKQSWSRPHAKLEISRVPPAIMLAALSAGQPPQLSLPALLTSSAHPGRYLKISPPDDYGFPPNSLRVFPTRTTSFADLSQRAHTARVFIIFFSAERKKE